MITGLKAHIKSNIKNLFAQKSHAFYCHIKDVAEVGERPTLCRSFSYT